MTPQQIDAMKLALEAYIKAGIGNSTDFVLQGKAYDLAIEALAQPEQEPKSTIRALTEQCAALVWERDKFKKQVQQYEKNGVTCQTYRHKVEQSCAECDVNESYTTLPKENT